MLKDSVKKKVFTIFLRAVNGYLFMLEIIAQLYDDLYVKEVIV